MTDATTTEATTTDVTRTVGIPAMGLVLLVGVSGSGKSTFAREHFRPTEVISSDFCRGLVSDDENDQTATPDAFDVLGYIAATRLRRGLLTVVDATNVSRESRAQLVQLARDHDVLPVAIVLDVPLEVALERNAARPDRDFGPGPVKRQAAMLRKSVRGLGREGFRTVHVLRSAEEVDEATVVRDRLLNDYSDQHGPFDIVGDVHGCLDELLALLDALGTTCAATTTAAPSTPFTPRAAGSSSSATSSTAARRRWACCASRWA